MAKVERVSYVKTDLEDKPGSLLALMKNLKSKNIGVAGLWGFGTGGGKATLYAIGKNPKKFKRALKAAGLNLEEGPGFFVSGPDRTGALNKTLKTLADAGINISALQAIAVGGRYGSLIWVDPSDADKAAKAMGAK